LFGLETVETFLLAVRLSYCPSEMSLSACPPEIRLRIYDELLATRETVVFVADYGQPFPPLLLAPGCELCPAILRVNRKMYYEAVHVLYSSNRFQFPDAVSSISPPASCAYIQSFLSEIGPHARLLRHIRINFPNIDYNQRRRGELHHSHRANLVLIRDTCPRVRILEMQLDIAKTYIFDRSPSINVVLDCLDKHIKSILFLEEIIINVQVYNEADLSESTVRRMQNYGWIVKISLKKLPLEAGQNCNMS
jgi:hypothetical protein